MLSTELLPEVTCEVLWEVGLQLHPDEVRVSEREARWLVELPNDQMAWFATSQDGFERLRVERKVLALLRSRYSFQVPRIVCKAKDGSFDARAKVKGVCDPWSVYTRVRQDSRLAERIGRAVGGILAEQHTRIVRQDVDPWLSRQVAWPQPSELVLRRFSICTRRGARRNPIR